MRIAAIFLCFLGLVSAAPAEISARAIALVYNSSVPESEKLAETYAAARSIPAENLIGLPLPAVPDISREQYEKSLATPLRAKFDEKRWWIRGRDRDGRLIAGKNQIKVLVTFKGVPLRITQSTPPEGKTSNLPEPFRHHDEASVDSELAMLAVDGLPAEGPLENKFFKAATSFSDARLPFLMLTCRIDAASFETCARMIRDAIETEKTGLWGMCYVDIANKFPEGDNWLEAISKRSAGAGIPTVTDRFNETFPPFFPMSRAATYFGWYDWNPSGPFLDPQFRFRKGAVAVHLHSFSAQQLTDPGANWCAPILERGAAATLGNVWEPYLHLTHNLSLFHERLLAGDTLAEAAWKSMPVTSWQGVVLGDPLYRPFLHLGGTGAVEDGDRDFRALRAAAVQWGDRPQQRRSQIEKAVQRTRSGTLAEALALDFLASGLTADAVLRFQNAKAYFPDPTDQLRQDIHVIGTDRSAKRKDLAISGLRSALLRYPSLPAAKSLQAWLDAELPPPPVPEKK